MKKLIKSLFYIVYASSVKQDVYDPKDKSLFMFGFFSAELFGPLWMISCVHWEFPSFLFPVGIIIAYFVGRALVKSIISSSDDFYTQDYIEHFPRYVHLRVAVLLLLVTLMSVLLAVSYVKLLAFF